LNTYNPEHYNVRNKYFWQLYFDRLAVYSKLPHSTISSVKFYVDGKLEFTSNNPTNFLKLLKSRFIVLEEEGKFVIPAYIRGHKNISKAIWIFIPQLFDPEENKMICESYIKYLYEKLFPKQFTAYFLKYLNKIVDLKDIIRKSGVQKVEFLNEGLLFIWPIYFLSKTRPEILNSITHGIMFSRNEIEKHESILVPYDFCWATLSGVCWSGNLKSLFSSVELFKNVQATLEENQKNKYTYCLNKIDYYLKSIG
jgi:hypothetical protein